MKDYRLSNANGDNWFGRPLDWDYDQNGDIQYIELTQMLDQNLKKISMTEFGSSELNTQYGTAIATLTGMKLDLITMGSLITNEMERIVALMQTMMQRQTLAGPNEKISSIDAIYIDSVDNDPRKILITVLVRTEDGNSVQLQTTLQPF
jgi:hypothetical protein